MEKPQPVKQPEVEQTRPTFDENLRRIMHEAEVIGARNRSIMRYEADRMYHDAMVHREAQRYQDEKIAYHQLEARRMVNYAASVDRDRAL